MMNQNKNKIKIIIILFIVIILGVIITFLCLSRNNNNIQIPNDYLAVFQGGSGEITYSTYIYKLDNEKKDSGYKYINTTNTTTSWGSSDWNINKTEEGTVVFAKDLFRIAEENNAYSYVELPNNKETYTIEEYQEMILSNKKN